MCPQRPALLLTHPYSENPLCLLAVSWAKDQTVKHETLKIQTIAGRYRPEEVRSKRELRHEVLEGWELGAMP